MRKGKAIRTEMRKNKDRNEKKIIIEIRKK